MGWIADLLKEIPSAARYKSELEAMEKESAALKNENIELRLRVEEIDAQKRIEELPEDSKRILAFLSHHEDMRTSVIAGTLSLSITVTKMHLEDLIKSGYIDAHYTIGEEPEHYLQQRGRKYVVSNNLCAL